MVIWVNNEKVKKWGINPYSNKEGMAIVKIGQRWIHRRRFSWEKRNANPQLGATRTLRSGKLNCACSIWCLRQSVCVRKSTLDALRFPFWARGCRYELWAWKNGELSLQWGLAIFNSSSLGAPNTEWWWCYGLTTSKAFFLVPVVLPLSRI